MDILNTFVHAAVTQAHERIIMKIRGVLVGMLLEIDMEKCTHFVIGEGRNKIFKCTSWNVNGEYFVLQKNSGNILKRKDVMSTHVTFVLQTKQ